MGWMIVHGACFGCGRLFSFNAEYVPSIPINGTREPICSACVARANPERVANGLEPIRVDPRAYEPEQVP